MISLTQDRLDLNLMHKNLKDIHDGSVLGLRVSSDHYLFLTRRPSFGFVDAMDIAERGFDAWAAKEHNRKWVRLIDGTPIKNDLLVNIAEAMVAAASGQDRTEAD